jgi:hypothetical protein
VTKIFRWQVLRWFLFGIVLALIVMQFVPVERSNPPVEEEVPAPANVRAMLRRACYDCHSNETRWPWYSHVAPVSWLVAHDVHEARKHLNFSTWNQYNPKRQARKLNEVWEEVDEGEMPLWYYLTVHRDAVLSVEDRALLRAWTTSTPEGSP